MCCLVGGPVSTLARSRPSECFQPGTAVARNVFISSFSDGTQTPAGRSRADRREIGLEQSLVLVVHDICDELTRALEMDARLARVARDGVRAGKRLVRERQVPVLERIR